MSSFEWYMTRAREKSIRAAIMENVWRQHVIPVFSATTRCIKKLMIGFGPD
jgi:hypothetical protein